MNVSVSLPAVVAMALVSLGSAAFALPRGDDAVQVRLTTASDAGPALATLIAAGPSTRLVFTLGRTSQGLSNPSVIAEVREGSCARMGTSVFRSMTRLDQPAPSSGGPAYSLDRNFGGTIAIPLSTLVERHYAITLRTGPEADDKMIACGNIG